MVPAQFVCSFNFIPFSALHSQTALLARHSFSSSGRLHYLKHDVSWLSVQIAAFYLDLFLIANSGFTVICLATSAVQCIPPTVLTQQIIWMVSFSSFIPVLIPPVLPVCFYWLLPLHHPSLWALGLHVLAALQGSHHDQSAVYQVLVSSHNRTIVSVRLST